MITIGSRGSKLALWQANFFKDSLQDIGLQAEIKIIKTQGDNIQHLGFDKLEGKGFFTKELEDALLNGDIDVAVHSMKDLPTISPSGLSITGVSYRADARDILLIATNGKYKSAADLRQGNPIIGTSSARRKGQIMQLFPNATIKDIRGNVPTRINKLKTQDFDAILLAKAGLDRLDIDVSEHNAFVLSPDEFVPAPAQGVLAYQTLTDNVALRQQLKPLHHPDVAICTNIERGVLRALDGGCQLPLGVHVRKDANNNYRADVFYHGSDGEISKFMLSQNTHSGMTELILEKIKTQ